VQHLQLLTIDCRPHVYVLAVDFDFRLIDGDLLTLLAVGCEQVLESMKPLSDCLVGALNEWFDLAVREVSMIQKSCEDTPLRRRVLTGKYFLLARLFPYAVEHC
jgi:hypothetical protein